MSAKDLIEAKEGDGGKDHDDGKERAHLLREHERQCEHPHEIDYLQKLTVRQR